MKKIDTKINPQESSFWASLILPMDLVMVAGCANNTLMPAEFNEPDSSDSDTSDAATRLKSLPNIGEAA